MILSVGNYNTQINSNSSHKLPCFLYKTYWINEKPQLQTYFEMVTLTSKCIELISIVESVIFLSLNWALFHIQCSIFLNQFIHFLFKVFFASLVSKPYIQRNAPHVLHREDISGRYSFLWFTWGRHHHCCCFISHMYLDTFAKLCSWYDRFCGEEETLIWKEIYSI